MVARTQLSMLETDEFSAIASLSDSVLKVRVDTLSLPECPKRGKIHDKWRSMKMKPDQKRILVNTTPLNVH